MLKKKCVLGLLVLALSSCALVTGSIYFPIEIPNPPILTSFKSIDVLWISVETSLSEATPEVRNLVEKKLILVRKAYLNDINNLYRAYNKAVTQLEQLKEMLDD